MTINDDILYTDKPITVEMCTINYMSCKLKTSFYFCATKMNNIVKFQTKARSFFFYFEFIKKTGKSEGSVKFASTARVRQAFIFPVSNKALDLSAVKINKGSYCPLFENVQYSNLY